jgi:predicted RNA binding protein YcfA (HicA-like mRNA interferase family)
MMPKKNCEVKKTLKEARFLMCEGKGSHSNWKYPQLETLITTTRRDGEHSPSYLLPRLNTIA